MKKEKKSPLEILQGFVKLNSSQTFIGVKVPDKNFSGYFLLIQDASNVYSFKITDIVQEEIIIDSLVKVTMRPGCHGMLATPFTVSGAVSLLSFTENSVFSKLNDKKEDSNSAIEILQRFIELDASQTFFGQKVLDKNFPGNFLLLKDAKTIYSFNINDIVKEHLYPGSLADITMRPECNGMLAKPFKVSEADISLLSFTENSVPPKPVYKKGDPRIATGADVQAIRKVKPLDKTLASVASNWTNSCALGDREINNCAHYLSDAFIKAGFTELKKVSANPAITEWCDWNTTPKNPAARPIRAKDMWAWFKLMATSSITSKPKKKGFWAVFQWDASYSGGHVLLYDSDNEIVYGTAAYWNWSDQLFYQW